MNLLWDDEKKLIRRLWVEDASFPSLLLQFNIIHITQTPKANIKHIKTMKENTFMKLWKVPMKANKNGGWKRKEKGLLPLKSVQIWKGSSTTRSFVLAFQGFTLSNGGFSWRERKVWNESVLCCGLVLGLHDSCSSFYSHLKQGFHIRHHSHIYKHNKPFHHN